MYPKLHESFKNKMILTDIGTTSSKYRHLYLSFTGRIKVHGLRIPSIKEAYMLVQEELASESVDCLSDAMDLAFWAIDQCIQKHCVEGSDHSQFFGPDSPTLTISLPERMFIMTKRNSFPTELTRHNVCKSGTWEIKGEEWMIDIEFDSCMKIVEDNDGEIDKKMHKHLYVKSDHYNSRFVRPSAPKLPILDASDNNNDSSE